MTGALRLGVNIDHIATLRNARGGARPDLMRAAEAAARGGADQITIHLREDRRHIRDEDVLRLIDDGPLPVNLEMAATDEMITIATTCRPSRVCLVPERREELTTEGGLDVAGREIAIADGVAQLVRAGVPVSLFVDADPSQIQAGARAGAVAVELHTGPYCDAAPALRPALFAALVEASRLASEAGVECHAGHGLDFETARAVSAIPDIVELNIGHFLVGEALFTGLEPAVRAMRAAMNLGRAAS